MQSGLMRPSDHIMYHKLKQHVLERRRHHIATFLRHNDEDVSSLPQSVYDVFVLFLWLIECKTLSTSSTKHMGWIQLYLL